MKKVSITGVATHGNVKIQSLYGSCEKIKMRLCESGHKYSCLHMKLFIRRASTVRSCLNVFTVANVFVYSLDKTVIFLHLCYTCQLFLRYKREIFVQGVLGFLKMTQSFPKIPEEVRSLPKMSEVFRRPNLHTVTKHFPVPVLGRV